MKKEDIYQMVDELETVCKEASRFIWNHPETGGNEKESANYYRVLLEREGFRITNSEKLEHAFYGEYGSGSPVIANLSE